MRSQMRSIVFTIALGLAPAMLTLGITQRALAGEGEASRRAPVDREAMEEAMGLGSAEEASTHFSSPFAYEHYLLARLSEERGELGRAIEELQLAAAHDPESPEIRLALGLLHAHLGNREQAVAQMERALQARSLGPTSELRASIEERLRSLGARPDREHEVSAGPEARE